MFPAAILSQWLCVIKRPSMVPQIMGKMPQTPLNPGSRCAMGRDGRQRSSSAMALHDAPELFHVKRNPQ